MESFTGEIGKLPDEIHLAGRGDTRFAFNTSLHVPGKLSGAGGDPAKYLRMRGFDFYAGKPRSDAEAKISESIKSLAEYRRNKKANREIETRKAQRKERLTTL